MIPKGMSIAENCSEKTIVCNYGQYNFVLKKGDRTPPLSETILDSFKLRHPDLKIVETYQEPQQDNKLSSEEVENKNQKTLRKRGGSKNEN